MASEWAYFDTSVLVKRYIRESGSPITHNLIKKYRLITSSLTALEARSALYRRRQAGDISVQIFNDIVSRLRQDCAHWHFIEISPSVLREAEEVITKTGVRTLDAIHLASATAFQAQSGLFIPFITADAQQKQAAQELDLETIWIE